MDEKEKVKYELKQELQWVQYRMKMLNIMDEKLLQMKQIAAKAEGEKLSSIELKALNDRLNCLAEQIRALDSESRKTEDKKIFE